MDILTYILVFVVSASVIVGVAAMYRSRRLRIFRTGLTIGQEVKFLDYELGMQQGFIVDKMYFGHVKIKNSKGELYEIEFYKVFPLRKSFKAKQQMQTKEIFE